MPTREELRARLQEYMAADIKKHIEQHGPIDSDQIRKSLESFLTRIARDERLPVERTVEWVRTDSDGRMHFRLPAEWFTPEQLEELRRNSKEET